MVLFNSMESVASEPTGCLSGKPKSKWNIPTVYTVPSSAAQFPSENIGRGGARGGGSGYPLPPKNSTK